MLERFHACYDVVRSIMADFGKLTYRAKVKVRDGREAIAAILDLVVGDVGSQTFAEPIGRHRQKGAVAATIVEHFPRRRADQPEPDAKARAMAPRDNAALAAELLTVIMALG